MTTRHTAAIGGGVGLIVPTIVLVLLWRYGIWKIMFRSIDLRAVLWPSSVMLTAAWCSTLPGILSTVSSVAINCLLYISLALILRAAVRALRGSPSAGDRADL